MELVEALRKDKNIIPIMLEGFNDFPEYLPQDIAAVRYKNGPKYDKVYFDAFYERLKSWLNGQKETCETRARQRLTRMT